jgi:hypothetical protein
MPIVASPVPLPKAHDADESKDETPRKPSESDSAA